MLGQVLGALAAHEATADDGHAARYLGLAGEHVPRAHDVGAVRTGHGDAHVGGARGHDHGLEALGEQDVLVCRNTQAQLGAGGLRGALGVVLGAKHLLLAWRHGGDAQLAAQALLLLEEGHTVATLGRHSRRGETGDAAADDGHTLGLGRALHLARELVAVLRVEHARDKLAALDGVRAALVA